MFCNYLLKLLKCANSETETESDIGAPTKEESEIIARLSKYNQSSSPKVFTMNGKEKWCKVINVYDGDTVDIIFYNTDELMHYKLRLYGIDTPELKPLKSISNRDEIIAKAQSAKKYLETLIQNKIVYVRFCNEEKYGRLMGSIYLSKKSSEISVNQMLVDAGHAKEYFGGKK
jgi:endonuclease YncB( thermonuclease family)